MSGTRHLLGRYVVLEREDIDTDQIIPARFLTATSRAGIGKGLFADWRFLGDGTEDPSFALNAPEAQGAEVLVAGRNFGCGSSREHAAWALRENGFRAVVSTEIADIFAANAWKNGIVPIVVPQPFHHRMCARTGGTVEIDVEAGRVLLGDGHGQDFELDPFSRRCLIEGIDELDYLLRQEDHIAAFEARDGRPDREPVS